MATKSGRTIIAEKKFSWKSALLKWETILILILILVNVMNASISPHYLSSYGLFTAIRSFLVRGAFIVFPMAFLLLLGEIDISVGATTALSAVIMAVAYGNGDTMPMGVAILLCLVIGTLCGLLNGVLLTRFTELAPMIVTLGTQILFRGIAEGILGDEAAGDFPDWFGQVYRGTIPGTDIPYMLIGFIILAVFFCILLHKTNFGRKVYAIGSNRVAAQYAGVPVQKIRCIIYTLAGTFSALTGILMAAKMGSVRSDIAEGYEMEAITMVVLGGISTAGGKGNLPGAIISIFVIGLLRYGLGLINIPAEQITIIVGILLIVVVLAPNLELGKKINALKEKRAA